MYSNTSMIVVGFISLCCQDQEDCCINIHHQVHEGVRKADGEVADEYQHPCGHKDGDDIACLLPDHGDVNKEARSVLLIPVTVLQRQEGILKEINGT